VPKRCQWIHQGSCSYYYHPELATWIHLKWGHHCSNASGNDSIEMRVESRMNSGLIYMIMFRCWCKTCLVNVLLFVRKDFTTILRLPTICRTSCGTEGNIKINFNFIKIRFKQWTEIYSSIQNTIQFNDKFTLQFSLQRFNDATISTLEHRHNRYHHVSVVFKILSYLNWIKMERRRIGRVPSWTIFSMSVDEVI